jgi:hypothetical protein
MARPRKVPAVLVEATVRRNAKLASLPSDSARLGYFYLLGDAKLSEPAPGQFASKAVFRDVTGRWARWLDDYIKVGLLELAPRLCPKCKTAWSAMPPKSGVLVVHDWQEHQYDPRKIERQREYEDRQRAEKEAAEAAVSDGVSDAQSDGVSDEFPTGDSRGRARDRAPNVERRTTNEESGTTTSDLDARNGREPTLSKAELDSWRAFGPEWNGVKAAWLDHGFRLPPSGEPDDPKGQRGLLFPILDARPTSLATWIRESKGKTPHAVVAHVLERWDQVKADAGVADEPNDDERDLPRAASAERLGSILANLPEPATKP